MARSMHHGLTRRDLLALAAAAVAPTACYRRNGTLIQERQLHSGAAEGRLTARPGQPTAPGLPGLQSLGLGGALRDGFLYVPETYAADRPAPLVVMLHGAGGDARGALAPFRLLADRSGVLLLAPESRRQTWDVIKGSYGPDVAFIDDALAWTFERYAVDPSLVAAEGFSDGASYALSLGLTNGDLFTHVIAFSPGFVAAGSIHGAPRIYVSHGTRDQVLPIDACSRRVVPRLENAGYQVLYREFDGPHTVPEPIADEAMEWFLPG